MITEKLFEITSVYLYTVCVYLYTCAYIESLLCCLLLHKVRDRQRQNSGGTSRTK